MNIVIPNDYLRDVTTWVLAVKEVETHAFLFGAFSQTQIDIGRIWETPPDMYEERTAASVVLKKEYVIKALEYARHNSFAIIDVHSHPHSSHAHFSHIDDKYGLENARWVKEKAEQNLFPKIPWGMIVIAASEELNARVFDFDANSFIPAMVRTPLHFGFWPFGADKQQASKGE